MSLLAGGTCLVVS